MKGEIKMQVKIPYTNYNCSCSRRNANPAVQDQGRLIAEPGVRTCKKQFFFLGFLAFAFHLIRDKEIDPDLFNSISEQPLYIEEIHPEGSSKETGFDGTLEEVIHLIFDHGYAATYPTSFGTTPGTKIAKAMDLARGGQYFSVPKNYPTDAWFRYDDETCDYGCMISEYFYWGLTTYLGAQDYEGRKSQIEDEWKITASKDLRTKDPALHSLLTNKKYRLPRRLPSGKYHTLGVINFTIQDTLPDDLSMLRPYFSKYVSVFGVHVIGTNKVDESKFLHAASVLAEYLDDNHNGRVNDPRMVKNLIKNKATLVIQPLGFIDSLGYRLTKHLR